MWDLLCDWITDFTQTKFVYPEGFCNLIPSYEASYSITADMPPTQKSWSSVQRYPVLSRVWVNETRSFKCFWHSVLHHTGFSLSHNCPCYPISHLFLQQMRVHGLIIYVTFGCQTSTAVTNISAPNRFANPVYTTFIMANSDFCIVAESIDEMIALTLTACQN